MVLERHKQQLVTGKSEISTDLDWVYHVSWSPDSKQFAVIGSKGSGDQKTYSVLVYDASTQKVIRVLPVKKPGSITGDIAFSPDGKYLAAGIGVISVWDAHTWQALHDIEGPYARGFTSEGLRSLAFSPDGKSLSALYERVVWPETIISRTREDVEIRTKQEKEAKRAGTFWEKLAKGEVRNFLDTIMAFNVETGKRIFVEAVKPPMPEHSQGFRGNLTYTPDGSFLLVSRLEQHRLGPGEQGRIRTFLEFRDPTTGSLIKAFQGLHVMALTALAVSPDGRYVATGTHTLRKDSELNPFTKQWDVIDNKDPIRLWDVSNGNKVREYGPLRGTVEGLAFTPDGAVLLSCQTDMEKRETLWLWDVASGELIARISTPRSGYEFFGCAISPNGYVITMPVVGKIYWITLQR